MEFRRRIEELAAETAQSFRAMDVSGPRQVGKTWLLTELTKRLANPAIRKISSGNWSCQNCQK